MTILDYIERRKFVFNLKKLARLPSTQSGSLPRFQSVAFSSLHRPLQQSNNNTHYLQRYLRCLPTPTPQRCRPTYRSKDQGGSPTDLRIDGIRAWILNKATPFTHRDEWSHSHSCGRRRHHMLAGLLSFLLGGNIIQEARRSRSWQANEADTAGQSPYSCTGCSFLPSSHYLLTTAFNSFTRLVDRPAHAVRINPEKRLVSACPPLMSHRSPLSLSPLRTSTDDVIRKLLERLVAAH